MSHEILNEHRIIWEQKPVLRTIYEDYYQRLVAESRPGRTLEIGAGTGNLKSFLPDVISTDIVTSPWIDCACDAQMMPFQDQSFDNIVMIDVLHHIERPLKFFQEAQRVLRPGGRILMMEPAMTCLGRFFYHHFHEEPVNFNEYPLSEGDLDPKRKPVDANQAFPHLIFETYAQDFTKLFPQFKILRVNYLSLFAYPLSGGFKKWQLIPAGVAKILIRMEKGFEAYLGKILGFRMMIVVEKNTP